MRRAATPGENEHDNRERVRCEAEEERQIAEDTTPDLMELPEEAF